MTLRSGAAWQLYKARLGSSVRRGWALGKLLRRSQPFCPKAESRDVLTNVTMVWGALSAALTLTARDGAAL